MSSKFCYWKAFALIVILGICGCAVHPKAEFVPSKPHIKIITYNINWGFVNPQNVIYYLAKADADIVCLQETHQYWETAMKKYLNDVYPYAFFHNEGAAGGIAVLSKYKLKNVRVLPPESGWFAALCGQVESPVGLTQFLNVHLRPPLSDRGSATVSALYNTTYIHRDEIAGFSEYIDANMPCFVAGDFNESENDKAIKWLNERGFTDSLSIYDSNTKTWRWKIFYIIKLTARYDHILFNKYFSCTGARVDSVSASDHMPVLAVLAPEKPFLKN